MSNLLAYGSQLVGGAGGSGGGGHVIEDATGTELTQQPTMQFTGYLSAEDDAANSKTVISAAPTTVEWSDWSNMTDEEKAGTHWLVVNAPNVGGGVDTNFLTKLWENPDPTSAFAAQTINLSSGDYDSLLCIFYVVSGYASTCVNKGQSIILAVTRNEGNNTYTSSYNRVLSRTSDTIYAASDCSRFLSAGSTGSTSNVQCIPAIIYGFKKTLHIDTTALIANVSTDASKCMLSDGVTSVEDAIDYSTTEHVVGKWIDGSIIYEKTISLGTLPNATSKNVAHGITNIGYIVSINGVAQCNSPFRAVNIPYAHATDLATQIQLVLVDTYITIYTAADWSSFTNNYVTIRYTKAS